MTYLFVRAFAPIMNLFILIVNLFVRRDKKIILFGSWMGEKFADNTRYIFQYLNNEKANWGLKEIVWVTRNKSVCNDLTENGYQAYMMYSGKSIYYHLKAGVHIVCNLGFTVNGYKGDILGQLSGRAIKINTWHGIPIKAGKSTGDNAKSFGFTSRLRYKFKNSRILIRIFSPGHWDRAYYLSTGKKCTRICSIFCGVPREKFIECGYPRDCEFTFKFKQEQEKAIIERIQNSKVSILYVPTFRAKGSTPHPLENQEFLSYIEKSEILWLEKPHSATKETSSIKARNNIILLDSSFDINVLIPYLHIIVTDYSSVYYDAMAFNRPIIFYSPDYDNYAKNDRGFLCDYKSIAGPYNASDISDLVVLIEQMVYNEAYYNKAVSKMLSEKKEMFEKQLWSIGEICNYIFLKVGIK